MTTSPTPVDPSTHDLESFRISPTLGLLEPLPSTFEPDRGRTHANLVVRRIPDDWDFDDEPADARDSLPVLVMTTDHLLSLPLAELRTCDGCGRIEDAGQFPDQDGEGRSECCWPTTPDRTDTP